MHNFTPDMFGLSGHGMRLRTIRGYDFGEVSSAMQKAIRRGETQYAGYTKRQKVLYYTSRLGGLIRFGWPDDYLSWESGGSRN